MAADGLMVEVTTVSSGWEFRFCAELFAHMRDRYELTLKPDKAHLSDHEIVGMLRANLKG